jgi:hypothetical protein
MRRWICFSAYAAMIVMVSFMLPLKAANVLFVYDLDGTGDGAWPDIIEADDAMFNHMSVVLGHTVDKVDDSAITAGDAAGRDYILFSASCYSGLVANAASIVLATDATIVHMESGKNMLAPFELTGGETLGPVMDWEIEIVALDGYLTKGFGLGPLTIYDDPEFGGEEIRTWGVTPPLGTDAGYPLADYTGDMLLGSIAGGFNPVVLGTHTHTEGNTIVALPFGVAAFDNLTADGLQLFNNVFATPELRADFDSDLDVDGDDFLAWQRGFGTLAPDASKHDGDANEDLGVDSFDLTIWAGAFGYAGAASSTPAVAAVPEPSAWALFCGMGLAGLLVFGRRRHLNGCVVPCYR